jgi:UDPglucose 6-dehydrogenase
VAARECAVEDLVNGATAQRNEPSMVPSPVLSPIAELPGEREALGIGKKFRVTVVGCGHVGAVTAACLAELGHCVRGVDVDASLVAQLQAGRAPFIEAGLDDLLARHVLLGNLSFTTAYDEALDGAEFVFLCVNTPATTTGAADLRFVRRAVAQIAGAVIQYTDQPLIVNKSTSPIGTGNTIEAIFDSRFPPDRTQPAIVSNPEFLREGHGVQDFLRPDRIVIGAHREDDARRVARLYNAIQAPVIITDLRSAELIKYVSNGFLATKVSFVNEIAKLCESLGVDVDGVLEGVSLDPRIGNLFMSPGVGYGGSCLPKDVDALCHSGDSVGLTMRVLSAVQDANIGQRKHVVNSIRRAVGRLEGSSIAAWGVTFKAGSEDLRESPAIDIINLLRNEGARVRVYDPSLPASTAPSFADETCDSAIAAAAGAHCVAILTDWPEFAEIDFSELAASMLGKVVYDGRNLLERELIEAAGLDYYGIGRPRRVQPSLFEEKHLPLVAQGSQLPVLSWPKASHSSMVLDSLSQA